jgi:4-hydroxy-tetrahydrodipicolinate synthase
MHTRRVPLKGVIAGVVTPFDSEGSVNWDELRHVAESLSASDADAICIGGFAGQMEGATPEEIFRLCDIVSRSGNKPLAAIIYPDTDSEAIDLIHAVESGGACAIFIAQPHYLSQPDPRGLIDMFARFRGQTRLPILLSNCQKAAMIPVELMTSMVSEGVVDGILIGGDGIHQIVDLLGLHLEVPVFSAIEDLHYVCLLLGAHGFISELAAAFPSEMADMYRAHTEGDHQRARACHERFARLWRALEHPSEQRARMRCVLNAIGGHPGRPRSPYNIGPRDEFPEVYAALEREQFIPPR